MLSPTSIEKPVHRWESISYASAPPHKLGPEQTSFTTESEYRDYFSWNIIGSKLTRLRQEELEERRSAGRHLVHPEKNESSAETVASQRLAVLAAQYAQVQDVELNARLEILNRRMLVLLPRVVPEQVAFLEVIGTRLEELAQRRIECLEQLGIE